MMSNILEHLKIYLLSSCFFVLCLASQPASPFTFEHGCHERQNCWKFLLPVFPEFSLIEGVKNSQEIKNNLGPKILLRAVGCYWQIINKNKNQSWVIGRVRCCCHTWESGCQSRVTWGWGWHYTHTRTRFKSQLPFPFHQVTFQFISSCDQEDQVPGVNTWRISLQLG